ncbi:nuclease-related domain-containing protein [Actinomadura scrupuli]|uniref:nuclease-related domain-containing protein n=1 Tax=Actinomadura scrupuli TaxID=559629 RepID=UPI003D981181
MSGGSFYFRDNPAFTGGSPQAIYEELWERGRRQRLIQRGIIAGVCLVLAGKLFSPAWGVFAALLAAGADMAYHGWRRAILRVWRRGQRGEQRTARVLRFTLEWRGYRVLHGRSVPGQGNADHLVIGPTGVWVIDNQAWDPETEFAVYGGKLFIGKDSASRTAVRLQKMADVIAELLSRELQTGIRVSPLLIAHGGRLPRKGLTGSGITVLRVYRLPGRILRTGTGKADAGGDLLTPEQIDAVTQAVIHRLPIRDHTVAVH